MSTSDPSRLDRLTALRNTHESALLDGLPVRDLAALSREYRATLAEIAQLAPPKAVEVDPVDEITARRAARGAGPSTRTARAGKGSA